MIRAAVIGYGYWGPNIVRNFEACEAIDLACVCDAGPAQLELVRHAHPGLHTTQSVAEVLSDTSIDAVAIVTPVASHFALGMQALAAGKHVWIEKPLTASSEEARRLCDAADARGRVLFVDHTFVHTGAVRELRRLCAPVTTGSPGGAPHGALGRLSCYASVRTNLGRYQRDVNVLWDLAAHDVSILEHVLQPRVTAVSATGVANVAGMPESSAFMTCFLEGGAVAHVHADWFAPVKVRTTTLTGDRRMIVYDDSEPVEKIRVWDRGVEVTPSETGGPPGIAYRSGPSVAPELDRVEALRAACACFAESIEKGTRPITGGALGLRVVEVLEAATRSMRDRGRPVEL